ncbi:hypothetical protein NDU88_006405 [Pleurodeles waltl]|uniref:Uncharacterized protein n=1 Tax=Pleurodeles waltl TaxID=8319 RepID=A0AAV7RME7_PLEWA|nr:hypothetical protein NDU88_006405 [Pleurodeles waltl]
MIHQAIMRAAKQRKDWGLVLTAELRPWEEKDWQNVLVAELRPWEENDWQFVLAEELKAGEDKVHTIITHRSIEVFRAVKKMLMQRMQLIIPGAVTPGQLWKAGGALGIALGPGTIATTVVPGKERTVSEGRAIGGGPHGPMGNRDYDVEALGTDDGDQSEEAAPHAAERSI